MSSLARIPFKAPGVYLLGEPPSRALSGVRLDVCAFAGVAPRGPAWAPVFDEKWRDDVPCVEAARPLRRSVAVAVESFDEYRRLYGAFEGPGLLPYAVASFFENGGRRAYIARIVHGASPAGVAEGVLAGVTAASGDVVLRARDAGAWGDRLHARMSFQATPLAFVSATLSTLTFASGGLVAPGTLFRLTLNGGVTTLRFVAFTEARTAEVTLDMAVPAEIEGVEVVEGRLEVEDGNGRAETHTALGLSREHPRWMGRVLCYESALVWPHPAWATGYVLPESTDLKRVEPAAAQFSGGEDHYPSIIPDDFFDPLWTPAEEQSHEGVHCFAGISDITQVAAPDLYSPVPLAPRENILPPVSLAGPEFRLCVPMPAGPEQEEPPAGLDGLRLDARIPADLETITRLQLRLVEFASVTRDLIALVDVPPGLNLPRILTWRSRFDSSYAAAYHPWLVVARDDDGRDALIRIPPSAAAAGIIAQVERVSGIPTGPAQRIAAGVVDVDRAVDATAQDSLHVAGINVWRTERDGARLSAARTLSRDSSLRQLSVRRLLLLLRRTLERQMQWAVFEPNNRALQTEMRHLIRSFLRQLYRQGAFRGATEEESFFVRCDREQNPAYVMEQGRFIAEIGVSPSEPLEYIVVQLMVEAGGPVTVTEVGVG